MAARISYALAALALSGCTLRTTGARHGAKSPSVDGNLAACAWDQFSQHGYRAEKSIGMPGAGDPHWRAYYSPDDFSAADQAMGDAYRANNPPVTDGRGTAL
jgi:hypothetical protein